jgi:hypothetical protein
MSIIAQSTEHKSQNEISYPCLGIFPNEQIVLFTSISEGTLIKQGQFTSLPIGTHTKDWAHDWKPYVGTVTLANEI